MTKGLKLDFPESNFREIKLALGSLEHRPNEFHVVDRALGARPAVTIRRFFHSAILPSGERNEAILIYNLLGALPSGTTTLS